MSRIAYTEKVTIEMEVVPLERKNGGQEIYVGAMELSAPDKERVFQFVKPRLVVDAGAGAGPLTLRMAEKFPEGKFIAVDIAEDMVRRMETRFLGRSNIEVVKADVRSFRYREPVSTVLHVSNMHEVFSATGFDHNEVRKVLRNDFEMLERGGRLIIRDGVQPEEETWWVKPLTGFAIDRFHKFVDGFRQVKEVRYKVGADGLIEIGSQDTFELLNKYFYAEVNLPVELSERFGVWTLREYQEELKSVGFKIVHAEEYVLDYLRKERWEKDFEIYRKGGNGLVKAEYPSSTMILVGEK